MVQKLIPIDPPPPISDNHAMSTETLPNNEAMTRMQEAANRAAKGIRDPERMRKAAETMDRISEEVHKRHGLLDIAVPIIRELRDE
jgi:hypothetical protein